jgi:2-polyprenyl-3-methyl-5-hydroxy-6-metoxy-1,4-benzoquinol methylase
MHNSLERIFPEELEFNEVTGIETLNMHLERYRFAGQYLIQGTVADIACGTGYGSMLLATEFNEKVSSLLAIDIDSEAISLAKKNYSHPKITYKIEDIASLTPNSYWQNIVSLETIEHIADPKLFIHTISASLTKGGRFIASVPITPSMDANPFHLHDFTIKTIRHLLYSNSFREIGFMIQKQPYHPFKILFKKEKRSKEVRSNLLGFYLRHPNKLYTRFISIIKDGFVNKYYVGAFEKI